MGTSPQTIPSLRLLIIPAWLAEKRARSFQLVNSRIWANEGASDTSALRLCSGELSLDTSFGFSTKCPLGISDFWSLIRSLLQAGCRVWFCVRSPVVGPGPPNQRAGDVCRDVVYHLATDETCLRQKSHTLAAKSPIVTTQFYTDYATRNT